MSFDLNTVNRNTKVVEQQITENPQVRQQQVSPRPNIVEKTPDIKIPESSNTPGGIHIKIVNGNDLAGSTPVESGKEFSITPEDINPSVINSNTTEPTPIIPAKTVTDGAAIDGGIVIKKV